MNEPMNNPRPPRSPQEMERIRRARAARRAKARRRHRRRQLTALAALLVVLGLLVFLFAKLIGGVLNRDEQTVPPTVTAEATVPTTEPEPTLPPVTWMNFPADRQMTAQQYFVYDVNAGTFLTISGQQGDTIYPASVTKLFTAYVALQYLTPETVVTAGDALDLIVPGSSVAELQRGDKLTAEQLVEAMLLPSGNDAAYVLAVEVGRILSGDAGLGAKAAAGLFVDEMNRQLNELGMTGSHFANPDGIHSSDHYTTFADLAILGKVALGTPTIMKYAKVAQDTVTLENGTQLQWHNTNATIDAASEYYCPYALGLKTGQTPSAGSCLLSAFECGGRTLVIGVFGCPEKDDRFPDTLQLFNEAMGFEPAEASVSGS